MPPSSQNRYYAIVLNKSNSTIEIINGDITEFPAFPTIDNNQYILLAMIYVSSGDTSINQDNIIDKRIIKPNDIKTKDIYIYDSRILSTASSLFNGNDSNSALLSTYSNSNSISFTIRNAITLKNNAMYFQTAYNHASQIISPQFLFQSINSIRSDQSSLTVGHNLMQIHIPTVTGQINDISGLYISSDNTSSANINNEIGLTIDHLEGGNRNVAILVGYKDSTTWDTDENIDIISVAATGIPTFSWNETRDMFTLSHNLSINTSGGGAISLGNNVIISSKSTACEISSNASLEGWEFFNLNYILKPNKKETDSTDTPGMPMLKFQNTRNPVFTFTGDQDTGFLNRNKGQMDFQLDRIRVLRIQSADTVNADNTINHDQRSSSFIMNGGRSSNSQPLARADYSILRFENIIMPLSAAQASTNGESYDLVGISAKFENISITNTVPSSPLTINQASMLHLGGIDYASNSNITGPLYFITTSISGCYLDMAGSWVSASSAIYKKDINKLNDMDIPKLMHDVPNLLSWKYNMEGLNDNDITRYGIIVEDLPTWLTSPGNPDSKGASTLLLSSFTLGVSKFIYNKLDDLEERVLQLEIKNN